MSDADASDDDRLNSMWVGAFAPGPVSPIIRGAGGAPAAAQNPRLVWWPAALALIPIIGLLFGAIAMLVAAVDVVSGRERAGISLAVALVAFAASIGLAALIIN